MGKKPDPFESPKRRLARGKQHIRRLDKRIQTFLKKQPHKRVAETDADGSVVHAIKFIRTFPNSWIDAAVEALEALRSALDQAGYAAATLGGAVSPKNAYFPIVDTDTELDRVTKGRCRDLPQKVSALFRGFDAQEKGNYPLWALNKLCNANKHRLLIPVGVVSTGMTLNKGTMSGGAIFAPRWNSDEKRIEFARIQPGGRFGCDGNLTFYIAFDEFNGVKTSSAVGLLDAIAGEAKRVLDATEAECLRLGLLH
jgi:hypothetical protein